MKRSFKIDIGANEMTESKLNKLSLLLDELSNIEDVVVDKEKLSVTYCSDKERVIRELFEKYSLYK